MNKVKITIGDYSQDGHNQYEQFVFKSNKTVQEIRQAYKDSCKLTGLSFNYGQDYTGLNLGYGTNRQIATEYGDTEISELAVNIFEEHNIKSYIAFQEEPSEENFLILLIDFIKLSIPDLILEEAYFKKSELKNIEAVNGWWNEELNCQFGYGLFE